MRFILEHKWERLGLRLDPTDYTDAVSIAARTILSGKEAAREYLVIGPWR